MHASIMLASIMLLFIIVVIIKIIKIIIIIKRNVYYIKLPASTTKPAEKII